MDKIITIRISNELEQLLEKSSEQSGLSKNEVIRQTLKHQLGIETFLQLPKELLPHRVAKGWWTDEDVFREVS